MQVPELSISISVNIKEILQQHLNPSSYPVSECDELYLSRVRNIFWGEKMVRGKCTLVGGPGTSHQEACLYPSTSIRQCLLSGKNFLNVITSNCNWQKFGGGGGGGRLSVWRRSSPPVDRTLLSVRMFLHEALALHRSNPAHMYKLIHCVYQQMSTWRKLRLIAMK